MRHDIGSELPGAPSIFEKSCVYCGARFRVLATLLPQGNQPEEYACPGCGKEYRLEAIGEPAVQLLHGRSDGKTDRYQETMF